jgi:RNA polymerase sigma-70 factor (ECF subfamily)
MEPSAGVRLVESLVETTDLDNFDALVSLYWPRVFRFALASLRDRDAAQTVTQDTFLKAHRGRSEFRGESSVQTWLMKIAVNLVRDAVRSRRFRFWTQLRATGEEAQTLTDWLPDHRVSPEENAILRQQIELAWKAAKKLSERQNTVFLLRFVEDMDLLEIASVTGMTESAVKVHLFRALQSIRKRVGMLI